MQKMSCISSFKRTRQRISNVRTRSKDGRFTISTQEGMTKGLNIRFYKRTKDCMTTGRIYETPFENKNFAVEFAWKKLVNIVVNINRWKLDKRFLKNQLIKQSN